MKTIALLLVAVLTLNGTGLTSQTTDEDKQAAKAKAEVQKRGVGAQSRVRVSLRNGTEVKGYINKIERDSFEVTDSKSGKVSSISYNDVNKVKGPGLSKGVQILIVAGIVIGVVVGIAVAVTPST